MGDKKGIGFVKPIKQFKPNAWGFYDMTGNMDEVVGDLIMGHSWSIPWEEIPYTLEEPPNRLPFFVYEEF